MGINYYLVSDIAPEMYALRRGSWSLCPKRPSREDLLEHAEHIAMDYGADMGDARRFAQELARWADNHDGKVQIVTDIEGHFKEYEKYTTTGDVADRHPLSNEEIQQKVKRAADELREQLGADIVDLFVTIENTPAIDDPDERHFLEYVGISGYDKQFSGYRLIRKKTT